ncbi:MAG: hypothetical protein GX595_19975 [Lentisphaerae bacterium]|nr:hypothetical protein [Lentisphaerota bacterium]
MKRLRHSAKQRGIALMMTLGILALLLIMAMSFAYTARTERLAAGVNTDLIKARLLAESAVERAIAFMRESYNGNPGPGREFFVPTAPPVSAWTERGGRYLGSVSTIRSSVDNTQFDIRDALATTIRVNDNSYDFTPAENLHNAVGWIPIMVDHGAAPESRTCIGLVAYLVIDETGKLDPNTAIGDIDTGYLPTYTGVTTPITEASGSPETRLGLDIREVALADTYHEDFGQSYSFGNLYGDAFRRRLTGNTRAWDSLHTILNRFRTPMPLLPPLVVNPPWLNRFIWSLRPWSVPETEAYQETFGSTAYHRCPVNDIDWNTIDIGTFPVAKVDAGSAYPGAAALGIPWVAQMTGTDPSTANQIKANIIDFLDDDVGGTAPTDTENDYPSTPPPYDGGHSIGKATYVGLEAVPFVNEVFIRTRHTARRLMGGPLPIPYSHVEIDLEIEGAAELACLYELDRANVSVTLSLEVTARTTDSSFTTPTQIVSLTPASIATNVGMDRYPLTAWGSQAVTFTFNLLAYPMLMMQGVAVEISGVRVAVAGVAGQPTPASLWDLAELPASPNIPAVILHGAAFEVSAEVNDPRCNLLATDWAWVGGPAASSGAAPATGTPGAMNTRCVDPGDGDQDSPDPTSWSTNFVRNGAVQSFWELGAIHRGEPWQTINLHSYDLAAGIGTYEYGDWPLLNQIRLSVGPPQPTRGLVNVWSVSAPVWKPLLQGLHYGSDYDNPAQSGTALPTSNTDLVAAAGTLHSGAPRWADGNPHLHGRAALLEYSALTDGSLAALLPGQATDARQEEIIGKMVGLFTDRTAYVTIIASAIAADDVGPLPPGMATPPDDWIEYQAGRYCRPMAEQRVMATVARDVTTNAFRILSFRYLED